MSHLTRWCMREIRRLLRERVVALSPFVRLRVRELLECGRGNGCIVRQIEEGEDSPHSVVVCAHESLIGKSQRLDAVCREVPLPVEVTGFDEHVALADGNRIEFDGRQLWFSVTLGSPERKPGVGHERAVK